MGRTAWRRLPVRRSGSSTQVAGTVRTTMKIVTPDEQPSFTYEIRLYSATELVAMVRAAGFERGRVLRRVRTGGADVRVEARLARRLSAGGFAFTRIAASSRIVIATAPSPTRLRPAQRVRSSRGRTTKWWNAPQASANETRPELDEQYLAVGACSTGRSAAAAGGCSGRRRPRSARRSGRAPGARSAGTIPAAARAPPARRRRRAGRARRPTGRRRDRCTQSASSVNQDDSTAEWPERDSPEASTSVEPERGPQQRPPSRSARRGRAARRPT